MMLDDWKELAEETKMARKVKRGKMSQEEFEQITEAKEEA